MPEIVIIYISVVLGFFSGAAFIIVERVSGNIDIDEIFGKKKCKKNA